MVSHGFTPLRYACSARADPHTLSQVLMLSAALAPLPARCPPDDARPLEMTAYRLAAPSHEVGGSTTDSDWQLPHQKRKGECAGKISVCDCHAHSVFADLDELLRASALVPWIRKKSIARVEIGLADGDLVKSPTDIGESHHDWWPSNSAT